MVGYVMGRKFEVGDVVQLNSGGPMMTVESVNGEGVFCIWFTNGRLECFKFDAVMLEKEVTLDA